MTNSSVIAPYVLLPAGWAADVRLDIGADGTIARITRGSAAAGATHLRGPVIPGMPNVHSHAFQRAFAGRAERAARGTDSFWTWRSAMYGLAERITPDDLEAIAAQVYVEMLEAGYTAVGEFHYVHHDVGGAPFAQRSEMAQRLLAAADASGIGITLLPVFYRWSGFGARAPLREQRRFITDLDGFMRIFDELAAWCRTPNRRLGIAPHSLRAVGPDDLRDVVAALDARDRSAPIHLHVAEQSAEVTASLQSTGMRPVQWLLRNAQLSPRWCLVHATHVDASEVAALAPTGAAVGICPTTEANLGDGIFPLADWLGAGGATAIGSDSHVSVDVGEEVRWLEYVQRLDRQRRAVTSSPEALYARLARDGGRAAGRPIGEVAVGARADFVVLDGESPSLCGADVATLLDRYLVTGARGALREVYVGGERVVADGRHAQRDAVAERYRATMRKLTTPTDADAAYDEGGPTAELLGRLSG